VLRFLKLARELLACAIQFIQSQELSEFSSFLLRIIKADQMGTHIIIALLGQVADCTPPFLFDLIHAADETSQKVFTRVPDWLIQWIHTSSNGILIRCYIMICALVIILASEVSIDETIGCPRPIISSSHHDGDLGFIYTVP